MSESAEQGGSAASPAEAVLHLSWLAPGAAALAVLARGDTSTWTNLRTDPGAVLLLLRHGAPPPGVLEAHLPPGHSLAARLLAEPEPCEAAARLLACPGFVDWSLPQVQGVYRAALVYARLAHHLAERSGACDPEQAWVCGLLAPLGFLAVSAVAPDAVAACLLDPGYKRDPEGCQRRHWGLDHAALARRLARHWKLPAWLTAVAGHLSLPVELARSLGADPVLFTLTRQAVLRARDVGIDLGLLPPGLTSAETLPDIAWPAELPAVEPVAWQAPATQPLLRDLLTLAAENRRLRRGRVLAELEQENDHLHSALTHCIAEEGDRLRSAKLEALAEFAAGAGHEINNPLAVISGQAQYLLKRLRIADCGLRIEDGPLVAGAGVALLANDPLAANEEDTRSALKAIIAQTNRVHGILRDVMQFARPAPPRLDHHDLPALMGEVAAGLGELAAARRVRVEVVARLDRLPLRVDGEQVKRALTCLLRNAIEAAPPDGWARLVLVEPVAEERVEVAVEDSGPGPDPAQRAFLFDPFFSGRSAGRGRGLGLPIAWRLARLQGGDVRLEAPRPGEPTRFLLILPRGTAAALSPHPHASVA